MPGWKKVQSKRKIKQNSKLAFLCLGILFVIIVFSQIFRFTKTLLSPWNISDSQRTYTWNGQFNINLILRSKGNALVSYNPNDQKLIIVDIPGNTIIDAGSFGKWQIRALYDLGGYQLLGSSMRDFFATPIDGFLDFSDKYKELSGKQIVELIRANPLGVLNILSHLKTDLTLMELIRLKLGFSSVRFDKVIQIDLVNLDVLQKDKLADGGEVLVADPNKLDVALTSLSDPIIKQEHKSVAVYNGSGKPLLAQKWARLISNMGADVVITTNASQTSDKTLIVGEQSSTLKRLRQVFNANCFQSCDKIQKMDEDLSSSRAQINVKLAPDLIN